MTSRHGLMESDGEYSSISSRSESSASSGDVGSPRGFPVIDSNSYTVPGNPLAPIFEQRPSTFSQVEPLAPIPRQRSLVQQEVHSEPSCSRSSRRTEPACLTPIRRETPARRDADCLTPAKKNREKKPKTPVDFRLPEIVTNDNHSLRSDEVLASLSRDGLLPDSQFIRHTRSGIAYHYMYGPPVRRPRRLPRIVSEGAVRRGDRQERNYLVDTLDGSRARTPRKLPGQKCFCSGGLFTEDIRCAVNANRQKREQRNSKRVLNQLQRQQDKVTSLTRAATPHGERAGRTVTPYERSGRTATPYGERAARVQKVRAQQDEIRQHEARRAIENFMKQKKRKQ